MPDQYIDPATVARFGIPRIVYPNVMEIFQKPHLGIALSEIIHLHTVHNRPLPEHLFSHGAVRELYILGYIGYVSVAQGTIVPNYERISVHVNRLLNETIGDES